MSGGNKLIIVSLNVFIIAKLSCKSNSEFVKVFCTGSCQVIFYFTFVCDFLGWGKLWRTMKEMARIAWSWKSDHVSSNTHHSLWTKRHRTKKSWDYPHAVLRSLKVELKKQTVRGSWFMILFIFSLSNKLLSAKDSLEKCPKFSLPGTHTDLQYCSRVRSEPCRGWLGGEGGDWTSQVLFVS
jgi:hypothetical protein